MDTVTSAHNFREMAERMRQLTVDSERARDDYERAEVSGISPDGTIRVTMRAGRTVSVTIDPSAMNHDNAYLAGQVMTAVQQAEERSAEFLSERTSPMIATVEDLRKGFR